MTRFTSILLRRSDLDIPQVANEKQQRFSRMFCMDGNCSLKRVRLSSGRQVGDTRIFEDSDYYLSQQYVDQYAGEVRARGSVHQAREADDVAEEQVPEAAAVDPLPADLDTSVPDAVHPASPSVTPDDPPEEHTAEEVFMEGDPTDGSPGVESTCTKNWKAAAADEKKRTWDIFEETGIFAAACRHAIMLWVIDMVRSGELCVCFRCS